MSLPTKPPLAYDHTEVKKLRDEVHYWKGKWEEEADECSRWYKKFNRVQRKLKRLQDEN